jgi:hypothetical protein
MANRAIRTHNEYHPVTIGINSQPFLKLHESRLFNDRVNAATGQSEVVT